MALLIAQAGCVTSVYSCQDDDQCPSGFCEASGFCSFVDDGCESGRRYGAFAGDGLGGTCVSEVATTDGSSTMSPGPDPTTATTSSGPEPTSTGEDPTTGNIVPGTDTGDSSTSSDTATTTGGGESTTGSTGSVQRVDEGLVVLYRLNEGSGATVHDTAPVNPPIDLTLEGTGYAWVDDGLRFTGNDATVAASTTSVTKVNAACTDSNALTLEAWVTPTEVETPGPPRIVTYSESSSLRNFSLMVGRDIDGMADPAFRGRVRVDDSDAAGLNGTPSLYADVPMDVNGTLVHVAYVHEADGVETLFVDGNVGGEGERPGPFTVWDTTGTMRIALGNEFTSPRALDGTLHLVAIYCRALSPGEVQQNLSAGF